MDRGAPGGSSRGDAATASVETGSAGSGGSGKYSATTRGGESGAASAGSGGGTEARAVAHPVLRAAAARPHAMATTRGSIPRIVARGAARGTPDPDQAARGSEMVKVVPAPGVDSTSMSPLWSWTVRNTIDRPMPLPPRLVVKYRSKIRAS